MKREHFLIAQFFLVAAVILYLFYRLMTPFFLPIAWAAVLVIIFFPGYRWLLGRLKSPVLASLIACLLIFVIIIVPSVYMLAALLGEAADALATVNQLYQSGELKNILTVKFPFWNAIREKLAAFPQLANLDFETVLSEVSNFISETIGDQAATVIANVGLTILHFILMLFSMFFFFRDGDKIVLALKRITPLTPEQVTDLYDRLRGIIEGMIYGEVIVAIIQGTLGGILFAVFGISSPVFWGAVMAFLAFIPLLGPFLIYIPAGVFLILSGATVKGIALIAIGIVVISQIDNILRPLLFKGRTRMHTLLLFFAILGGLYMFGLIGIVLGPLVAAVFVSLLQVFEVRLHADDKRTPTFE